MARLVRESGLTFDEAREVVRATTVFTTHTRVPAGHDRFGENLMRRYFSDVESWLGLPWERFFELGSSSDDPDGFNMTYLAVRLCGHVNGVSRMHGDVSRSLLRSVWPGLLPDEVPIHPSPTASTSRAGPRRRSRGCSTRRRRRRPAPSSRCGPRRSSPPRCGRRAAAPSVD